MKKKVKDVLGLKIVSSVLVLSGVVMSLKPLLRGGGHQPWLSALIGAGIIGVITAKILASLEKRISDLEGGS